MKYLFLVCICFLMYHQSIIGQQFGAGVIVGLNASQITGDDLAGFDKLGFNVGLRTSIVIGDKADLDVELLYSQRGSRADLFSGGVFDQKITLHYIEIPVVYTFLDWLSEDGEYFRMKFHGGLSYGRLFRSSINDESLALEVYDGRLKQNDVSFILGATYQINHKVGAGVRYINSINKLYSTQPDLNANELKGYYLSFRLEYTIL